MIGKHEAVQQVKLVESQLRERGDYNLANKLEEAYEALE